MLKVELSRSRGSGATFGPVGVVFGAELRAQQASFRPDAADERHDGERREQDAHTRSKRQSPTKRVHQQSLIAGVTDDAIDTGGKLLMLGLDRGRSTEPMGEDKHRP